MAIMRSPEAMIILYKDIGEKVFLKHMYFFQSDTKGEDSLHRNNQ